MILLPRSCYFDVFLDRCWCASLGWLAIDWCTIPTRYRCSSQKVFFTLIPSYFRTRQFFSNDSSHLLHHSDLHSCHYSYPTPYHLSSFSSCYRTYHNTRSIWIIPFSICPLLLLPCPLHVALPPSTLTPKFPLPPPNFLPNSYRRYSTWVKQLMCQWTLIYTAALPWLDKRKINGCTTCASSAMLTI